MPLLMRCSGGSCTVSCSSFTKVWAAAGGWRAQRRVAASTPAQLPRSQPTACTPRPRHPPFLVAQVERNNTTERKRRECFFPYHHLAAFESERPASFLSWGTTRRAIALRCCRQICLCALQPGGTALAGRRSWRRASEVGRGEGASEWRRNLPGLRHVP